jgi:hypothetical protein
VNGAERYLHYEAKGRRIGVYCRLCGLGPYHYLGNHVFNTHGIRSSEYRKRFPDADMTPPEYRTAIHQELIDKGSRPGSKGEAADASVGIRS